MTTSKIRNARYASATRGPAFVALALCGVACGGNGGGSNATGNCANPAGLYQYVYTQQGSGTTAPAGDCSAIASFEQVLPAAMQAGCVVTGESTSANGCSASVQETCSSGSVSVTSVATVDGTPDEARLTGSLQTTQSDAKGNVVCQGLYTFVATKLHS
jgi:hypothetical protein